MRAQMEQVLQNPQQCAELMQLCIARTEVLTLFPAELRLRITPVPPTEEEVETRSDHSMASGLPLQMRAPTEEAPSSTDLVHWPAPQLFGLIRASTDQLEQRLQEAERSTEIARKEQFVAHTYRMQEAHDKLQVQHKLEKVQEKLVEAWPEIQKVAPELPEASDVGEPEKQIELLQEAWTQLATRTDQLQVKLQQVQQEAEQQPQQLQEQMQKIVLQGNNARATLHKHTMDCTKIFREVSDWMGIIARWNQVLEEVHTKIQVLNEEVAVTMDPMEQQQKFDQIQQADNELNTLYEAQSIAKKELHVIFDR
jgi:hypothetical protein